MPLPNMTNLTSSCDLYSIDLKNCDENIKDICMHMIISFDIYLGYIYYSYVLNLNYIDICMCGFDNGHQTVLYRKNTANF